MASKRPDGTSPWFPSREEVLRFIKDNPDKAAKRDIAKAFGIRGDARIELKRLLKDLMNDGLIEGRKRRFSEVDALPGVMVLDIFERDQDGELIAAPAKWDNDNAAPPRILITTSGEAKGRAAGVGDRVLARLAPLAPLTALDPAGGPLPTYSAHVIKILEKTPASVLGVVRFGSNAKERPRLLPVDRKQREIEIDHLNGAEDGDLVEVTLTTFGKYGDARARIVNRIGSLKSEKAISHIALCEQDIPHIFPEEVLSAAEAARETDIGPDREDWRTMPLITIDPADAKDHDDAVFAEADTDPENEGGFLITVAIADVAFYIRAGTPLDREALNRGNSVYFPDRVVPMLPERISNHLCSLKEGLDRPALAVQIVISRDGQKRRHRFHRIMMRSHASLSYQEAQAAIEGNVSARAETVLENTLQPLWRAYAALKRERQGREPLDLSVTERKIRLDADGRVLDVYVPERLDAHKLIEEYMILANVAAAEALEARKSPVVYRAHDAPTLAKLEGLREFLATIEMQIPKAGNIRPQHFNRILDAVRGENHELLTNQVVLRSQAQAEYTPENYGHFGLNLKRYAHFTSPIRRYADLIVHRSLIAAFKLGAGALGDVDPERLREISEHISMTERRAMKAERATIDRLIAEWLADKVGARFWGRIGGVTKSGLFITLDETGADGFIPISTLHGDYYHFNEARHSLNGERTGQTFTMGDRVEVELVEALPFAGALRFAMLSEGSAGKPGERLITGHKGKRRFSSGPRLTKGPGGGGGAPNGISRKVKRRGS